MERHLEPKHSIKHSAGGTQKGNNPPKLNNHKSRNPPKMQTANQKSNPKHKKPRRKVATYASHKVAT